MCDVRRTFGSGSWFPSHFRHSCALSISLHWCAYCSQEDVQEEFGWKLVHGDVFRPPKHGMLLSVMVGSGVQLFVMMLITLFFACLGFLSPSNRGALITCALVRIAYRLSLSPIAFAHASPNRVYGCSSHSPVPTLHSIGFPLRMRMQAWSIHYWFFNLYCDSFPEFRLQLYCTNYTSIVRILFYFS